MKKESSRQRRREYVLFLQFALVIVLILVTAFWPVTQRCVHYAAGGSGVALRGTFMVCDQWEKLK